jgi:hypothetical protein
MDRHGFAGDEHVGDGGMTGATGDLVPERTDEAFAPGERREIEDDAHHADMTESQIRRAPAQQGESGDPGSSMPTGGPTNLASRDEGYGSEQGLNPQDPAYRMETHPSPTPEHARPNDDTIIGGDEVIEEPRF